MRVIKSSMFLFVNPFLSWLRIHYINRENVGYLFSQYLSIIAPEDTWNFNFGMGISLSISIQSISNYKVTSTLHKRFWQNIIGFIISGFSGLGLCTLRPIVKEIRVKWFLNARMPGISCQHFSLIVFDIWMVRFSKVHVRAKRKRKR